MDENRPTLEEIETLAQQLGVSYTRSQGSACFDLDRNQSPQIHGTYQATQQGVDVAFGDLKRLELTLQTLTEIHQRALDVYQPGMSRRQLAAALSISIPAAHSLIVQIENDSQDVIADPAEK